MARRVALVLVLALVIGACGDGFDPARDRDRSSQSSAELVVT
jgi:hypothetical protein